MSCYFYILCKYWRKHLRTALSLLFSGLLLTAIITSVFLFIREEINREVETGYETFGKYDLILSDIPDDIKNELIPSDLTFTHETVTVPGKPVSTARNITTAIQTRLAICFTFR